MLLLFHHWDFLDGKWPFGDEEDSGKQKSLPLSEEYSFGSEHNHPFRATGCNLHDAQNSLMKHCSCGFPLPFCSSYFLLYRLASSVGPW